MAGDITVALLGPVEVAHRRTTRPGRRRQAAVPAGPARPRRAAPGLRRPPARGAVGRRPAGQAGQRPAGAGLATCAGCSGATSSSRQGAGLRPARRARRRSTPPPRALVQEGATPSAAGDHARRASASAAAVDARPRGAARRPASIAGSPGRPRPASTSCVLDGPGGAHRRRAGDRSPRRRRRRARSTSSAAHPLRERFRAQLIVALYRVRPAGRRPAGLPRRPRRTCSTSSGSIPGPSCGPSSGRSSPTTRRSPRRSRSLAGRRAGRRCPSPLTSFVGRDARARRRVDTPSAEARLVTLVGPAGVGKTRLALELARRLADRRRGVVRRAGAGRTTAVGRRRTRSPPAVGAPERAAGGRRDRRRRPAQRAVERLADRDAVVVLDNCEHVADAAAAVVRRRCSRGCPRRPRPGHEPRAARRRRASTRSPSGRSTTTRRPRCSSSAPRAVQPLFDRRRRRRRPAIADARAATSTGCRWRSSSPRPAPRRSRSPEIAEPARRPLPAAASRPTAAAPSRHDGLEAAIDWSYDLLFDDERRAFRRLAVFSGGRHGRRRRAAVRARRPRPGQPAGRPLAARSPTPSGAAVRFRMLESLRAYGLERLADDGRAGRRPSADHLRVVHRAGRAASTGDVRGRRPAARGSTVSTPSTTTSAPRSRTPSTHDPEAALRLVRRLILPWWFRGRRQEIARLVGGRPRRRRRRGRRRAGPGAGDGRAGRRAGDRGRRRPPATDLRDELAVAEARQREAIASTSRRRRAAVANDSPAAARHARPAGRRSASRIDAARDRCAASPGVAGVRRARRRLRLEVIGA